VKLEEEGRRLVEAGTWFHNVVSVSNCCSAL